MSSFHLAARRSHARAAKEAGRAAAFHLAARRSHARAAKEAGRAAVMQEGKIAELFVDAHR